MNKSRRQALIELLTDKKALDADRDDAAMDLGEEFRDDDVLVALIQVAKNSSEPDFLLESSGEAIGKILLEREDLDKRFLAELAPIAKYAVDSFIKQ